MQKDFVDNNGINLFYQRAGTAEQAIIFIHGLGFDSDVWLPTMEKFKTDFTVIGVDLRGHGRSGAPRGTKNYIPENYVDDLDAIIEKLNIKKPYLVGWSLGGIVAMGYAFKYPDKISKLVLVDSTPKIVNGRGWKFGLKFDQALYFLWLLLINYRWVVKHLLDLTFNEKCSNDPKIDEFKKIFTEKILSIDKKVMSQIIRSLFFYDIRPKLAKITVPTLIISGSNDVLTYIGASLYMRSHIPNSRFYELVKKGHGAFLTDSKNFNTVIKNFFNGTDELCNICTF